MEIHSEITTKYDCSIPFNDLFQYNNIRQISELLQGKEKKDHNELFDKVSRRAAARHARQKEKSHGR
jgi:hypothetical protein